MTKKANIFANIYQLSHDVRKVVEDQLADHDMNISYNHDDDADFNVVIGGDGTFIKAVHDSGFAQIPFLGINTGHLGFFNDVKPDEVNQALNRFIAGDYIVHDLKVLECDVYTKDNVYSYKSINEVVLKAKYTSIIRFDLYVDGIKLQSYGGDGVIFSTSSGSTAYSLSAGGAILYQNLDAFEITPLAAIRSSLHRSLDKALIVPKETKVKVVMDQSRPQEFAIGVDGLLKEHDDIQYLELKLSNDSIKKVVFDKNWFWKNIRDKFI